MKNVEEYAEIIMRDEREKIISETPTIYNDTQIERVYTFEDGAIVKYEWQSIPTGESAKFDVFNHRFTLIELPEHNPHNFKVGIIKTINYPHH